MLAQELDSVVAEATKEHPVFDFAISAGAQPRYWIDVVAHVDMGRDKRTYRFVRDTRLGRVVLAESTDIKPVADAVTRYVAERLVERQRAMENPGSVSEAAGRFASAVARPGGAPSRSNDILSAAAIFVLGLVAGAAITLAVLRNRLPELQSLFGG